MKFSDKTFIDEGSSTAICLIFRAKRYQRYWRSTYKQLYPKLCKKGKEYVDKWLPKVKLVTQKELDARKCIFCNRKKCKHGPHWLEEISLFTEKC